MDNNIKITKSLASSLVDDYVLQQKNKNRYLYSENKILAKRAKLIKKIDKVIFKKASRGFQFVFIQFPPWCWYEEEKLISEEFTKRGFECNLEWVENSSGLFSDCIGITISWN